MLNKSVARRYAEAFFSIARDSNKIDDYQTELEKVVKAIQEVDNLKEYMTHLLIPAKAKKDVLKRLFAETISPVTLNFIMLIVEKKRETYLEVLLMSLRIWPMNSEILPK
jgi:F-type H+-transporting ATPase subunit delta